MALVVLPWLDVVAGPDVLKAGPFGRLCLRNQLVGAELLVGERQTHTPLPAGGGVAGCTWSAGRSQLAENPALPSTPVPAANRPNVRREMSAIACKYPVRVITHVAVHRHHQRKSRHSLAPASVRRVAPQTRPAGKDDLRDLSHVLARAFYDDPVMMWLLPKQRARTAQLRRLFAAMTRHHHLALGGVEVACDGPSIGAAALWDPPNHWQETRRAMLLMSPTFIRVFGLRSAQGQAVQELMKRAHPEEPHWYLAVIGSDPTVRGKGFGQALMRSRLDRCDAEYCPAYLESTKLENVPYYQRFGFEVTREIALPDGGPTMWAMWRAPR